MRPTLLYTVLALAACALEPVLPPISGLAAYECGNVGCTQLGAKLTGLPPRTGLFMVAVWFRGTHDVHWAIRWAGDSVSADFAGLADSSMVAAQLDDIPLTAALILSVSLLGGPHDSLAWDFR